ncbi:MAG: YceI family protein [Microbacterium sp.]|uniref:YceI family protein n=1 Tax=Microbacterium sp. TaxID=51671 RepID=UPI0039E62EDE
MGENGNTEDEPMPDYIAGRWFIDPTHSQVAFAVRHSMIPLRCTFTSVTGVIDAGDRLEDTRVVATIDPVSFSSGFAVRDQKVRSLPSFLWVDMYPTIEFASTSIQPHDDGLTATMTGELTLLGVTREVSLQVVTSGIGRTDHYGARAGFVATGRIDRRDFGIRGPSEPMRVSRRLSDDNEMLGWTVDVEIVVEAVLQADAGGYGIDAGYAEMTFEL